MNSKRKLWDEVIESIVSKEPDPKNVVEAGERLRLKLFGVAGVAQVAGRIQSCDDFCGLIPAYLRRTLSDSRRVLLDDHVRECVRCRKALEEGRNGKPKLAVHVINPVANRRIASKWAIAAAALIAAATGAWFTMRLGSSGEAVATVDSIDGVLYQVSDQGSLPLGRGRQLMEGDQIRAGRGSHAVVRLFDGSLIEMNERSELAMAREARGTTIRLARGNIIVQAAKQKSRKLFVVAGESTVAVKGTIFSVNRGTKGTRVSVVEGAVEVDQSGRKELLKPGGQTISDASLATVPVRQEVAWSRDSARYLALLGELTQLQQKLLEIPSPGLRYQSNLARYVPGDTMIFAAIPNVGEQLKQARAVFEEQTKANPILRDWWTQQQPKSARLLEGLDRLHLLSQYVGDEAVLIVRPDNSFALLAEVTRQGVEDFLTRELNTAPQVLWKVHHKILIMSSDAASLAWLGRSIDAGGTPLTPFQERIARAYESGAGWLLAVNVPRMNIPKGTLATDLGVDNLDTILFERREAVGRIENSASLRFGAQRRGVASWLGAPGPLSTLDFVSPDASVATAFVMKNPRQLVEELLERFPDFKALAANMEAKLGVRLADDIAGPVGSEVSISQDGPLLPELSWKVAIEVNAPRTLQSSIEKLVGSILSQPAGEGKALRLTTAELGGRTYYQLSGSTLPATICYTYSDGYLIAAPSQSLVAQAIENRRRGYTLPRSERFRSQLPYGANTNFSALLYHNISRITGPAAEQLRKMNVLTEEQRRALGGTDQDMKAGLIYVYGEADRIAISSQGGFFGLKLSMLAGVDRGLPFLIPQWLGTFQRSQ